MIKKLLSVKNVMKATATLCLTLGASNMFAQFSPGNVVVLQAGDGSSALSTAGNPVVLKEFTPIGTPAFTVAVPTSTTNGLVIAGSSSAEGLLNRSANGQELVLAGYSFTNTNLPGTTSAAVPRVIVKVDAAGTATRVASSSTMFTGGNIRCATSDGSNNYWASGSNQGTNYFGNTASPTLIQGNVANTRALSIIGGTQMLFSTGSGTLGIYAIASGVTTSPSVATLLIATGTGSQPYQFCVSPTFTVGYIADDRAVSSGGGVQKWVYNGSAWNLAYTFATSTNTVALPNGARGLTADFSGPNPIIYVTTTETTANRLVSIIDGGSLATSTITTLATASPSNTAFRGVALSPAASTCTAPVISSISSNAPICSNTTLNLQSTVTGSGPLTYAWFGSGSFNSTSVASPSVTGASSGSYTLVVTNSCGTAASIVTATVTPSPTVTVNGASICSGGSATLTAHGASSYAWSPAGTLSTATGSVVSANPTSTTVYTIVGTIGTCTSSAQSTVSVIASPTVSVNSVAICAGSSATLVANGASTYTWTSPVSNNASITVNPTSTTVYTVSAQAAGCVGTFTATGTVSVTPVPTVTVSPSSPTICAGQSSVLTAGGATTYTWMPGNLTAATITVTPSTQTTYTVKGVSAGCAGNGSVIVAVNALPTIAATSATICTGKTVVLTASGTAASYLWNPTSATTNTILVSAANAGLFTFTVTGTSAQGCSKSISTTLTGIATPTINVTATQSVICIGNPVTLTATGANTYVWTGGVTNGTAFSPTTTATYTVVGTVTAGSCTNSAVSTVTVNTCTGINETTNATVLNIFPNPNSGTFVVQSTTFPATLLMYDVTGKQVLNKNITEMETTLNVSELGNGIYHLRLSAQDNSVNYKVIIAK